MWEEGGEIIEYSINLLNIYVVSNFFDIFQRTGQMPPLQDLYGKVPRGPSLGPRPGMEEMDFSDDDDRTPLTEPIYNGR